MGVYFYHGTRWDNLDSILEKGLEPRWTAEHNYPQCECQPKGVFLMPRWDHGFDWGMFYHEDNQWARGNDPWSPVSLKVDVLGLPITRDLLIDTAIVVTVQIDPDRIDLVGPEDIWQRDWEDDTINLSGNALRRYYENKVMLTKEGVIGEYASISGGGPSPYIVGPDTPQWTRLVTDEFVEAITEYEKQLTTQWTTGESMAEVVPRTDVVTNGYIIDFKDAKSERWMMEYERPLRERVQKKTQEFTDAMDYVRRALETTTGQMQALADTAAQLGKRPARRPWAPIRKDAAYRKRAKPLAPIR